MSRLKTNLIFALALLVPGLANAAGSTVSLAISCNSEDDGHLNALITPSDVDQVENGRVYIFDKFAGAMSTSRLRVYVNMNAEVDGNGAELSDSPQILIYPRTDSLTSGMPLASTSVNTVISLAHGKAVGFNVYALGHTDPEGLDCSISVVQ